MRHSVPPSIQHSPALCLATGNSPTKWWSQVNTSNQKWVSDMTYLATLEGWLYLAVVLDLFTRKVVGWSMRMGSPISMSPGVIPTSRNFSEMGQHCRKFKNWPATPTSI